MTKVLSAIRSLEAKRSPVNHECKTQVSKERLSCVDSVVNPPDGNDNTKLLGVNWDSYSDRIYFDMQHVIEFARSLPPTKRSLLKIAAKVFDPLGCLSLFTINLKVMFQQFCLDKKGWDDELSGDERSKYEGLISDLRNMQKVSIPRCYFVKGKKVQFIYVLPFTNKKHPSIAFLHCCSYQHVLLLLPFHSAFHVASSPRNNIPLYSSAYLENPAFFSAFSLLPMSFCYSHYFQNC